MASIMKMVVYLFPLSSHKNILLVIVLIEKEQRINKGASLGSGGMYKHTSRDSGDMFWKCKKTLYNEPQFYIKMRLL